MGRPRKFDIPFISSIKAEQIIFATLKALDIPYADALKAGAEVLIMDAIKNGRTGTASKEQLESYLEYERATIEEVAGMVRRLDRRKQAIENIQRQISEKMKPPAMIVVYDNGDETIKTIPESQYDPNWHKIRRRL